MNISSYQQTPIITQQQTTEVLNSQVVEQTKTSTLTNTNFNKESMLYFEPKIDISMYQISDEEQEKQNQIDKDVYEVLINSLETVKNDKDKYTFVNVDLDLDVGGILSFFELMTPERIKKDELSHQKMMLGQIEINIENQKRMMNYSEYKTEDEYSADYKESMMGFKEFLKSKGENDTYENFKDYKKYEFEESVKSIKANGDMAYSRNFKLYDERNIDELKEDTYDDTKKLYQGTYRLADEFVNSENMDAFMSIARGEIDKKQADIYDNSSEHKKRALRHKLGYMWDHSFDDKVKADVIGANRSKSEWIEHFQNQKSHIEEVLNDDKVDFVDRVEDKLHKNIEFIDKNIKTLLDKWENTEPSFNIYG